MSFITTPGDGRLAILKILNIITDKNYTLNDVTFSNPVPNTDVTKNRNTKVTVTFKPENGNYGSKEIFYNRIHISDLPVLTVVRGSATTYHQLIPVLNSTYNLNLTTADVDNGPLPDIVSANITITLPVANNSYLYYDSASISTVGFNPNYDIFKPAHTLLSYICQGFTRYGEYSDNNGGIYRILLQSNSPDCGFEDGLPRIEITNPGTMSALEEDNSGVFTLELVNPNTPVTVTLVAPGLSFSTNNIVLNSTTPTATFTVSSNNPGLYEIEITNDSSISNPINRFFNVIDKYNTTFSIIPPSELESIANITSQTFTIQGLNIDPGEPVTVNINTTGDLDPNVSSVVLTSAQPTATFTVNSPIAGVYFITFTNNRGLVNPNQIPFLVRPTLSLVLTPPLTPVIDDQQSGLFTVTLVNGFEDVTITPVAPGSAVINPSSFILTPQEPTGSFRLTYLNVGNFDLDITNNAGIPNPATYEVTVLPAPYITITPPAGNIYTGQTSGNFTVQLFNAIEAVAVTLSGNVDSISTPLVNLNPSTPIATFTITEAQEGNYTLNFVNNRSYSITTSLNVPVLRTLVPQITLQQPGNLNLEVGQESANFTVTLIDHPGPVTISINTSAGLTPSVASLVLDDQDNIGTFTVTPTSAGSKTVSLTNNSGIPNPGNVLFNARLPDFVELTTVPGTIRQNTLTDNFLVTLQNPFTTVTVTPSTENGSFSPASVNLSVAQPTATFRGTFTQEGPATITLGTTPLTPSTAPTNLTVLEEIEPELTLTGPSGTLYPGDTSGNFTVTLVNGQSNVTITVVTETDSASIVNAILTPAQPSVIFTVTDNQAGVYNVSVTNNTSIINPSPVPITFSADTGSLQFTGPGVLESEAGEVSGNFTVTGVNLVRPVIAVPNTAGNRTFTPADLTLTPAQPSGTFTLNSTDIGVKTISLSNNRGYTNPPSIDYEFLTPTSPYLTLSGPVPSSVFVNEETGDFTITLNNPEDPVTVNVVVIKNSIDVTSQVLAVTSYPLSVAQPTATFKLLPQIDGVLEVSITNASSIPVPPTPINITASYNTIISIQLLGNSIAATCYEDTQYTLSINRNHSVGSTVVDLPTIPGVTFQYSQITINNGITTYPVLVSFANIATYELFVEYAGSTQSNIIDVTAVVKPSYTVTPSGPLSIEEDSPPTQFTVTGTNLDIPVIVSITTWGGSGLNTSSVTITPADPVETFTIAPTNPGSFNLVFTNNSVLQNEPNIPVTVIQKPSLTLTRTGTGNIKRDQDVTFTVTLLNGNSPVEVTPVSDINVTIDGYIAPLILTPAQPTATFTASSDIPDDYTIGITNTSAITNPPNIPITVINGSIILTVLNTSLEVGVQSDAILVELENYDLPTVVTITLSNFTGGTLTIDPSDEFAPNQILLNSSNRSGVFTITKNSTGTVNLSITNNKTLANPTSVDLAFFDEPMYTVLSPLVTNDLINQPIGPYTVTGQTLNVPINDKLHADPYRDNVVLFLDFYDPIGNVITDKSPLQNTVQVFGNAQINTFSPIYGDRGYLAPTSNGDYLSVNNIDNRFDFPGDFTIEVDLVRTALVEEILIDRWYSSSAGKFLLGINGSYFLYWSSNGTVFTGSTPINTSTGLVKIAISRVGSDLRMFVNGKLAGQFVDSVIYEPDSVLVPVLGIFGRVNQRVSTQDFSGRVGKVKITKGVGRYTGNYTPEVLNPKPNVTVIPYHDKLGTDPHKNSIVLFLDFSGPVGNNFTDISPINNKINRFANITMSTTNPIYGDTVAVLDGNGDYLTINENVSNFHFPGDFTIEVDFVTDSPTQKSLIDLYKQNIQGYYHLWLNNSSKLEWITYDSGSIVRRASSLTIAINTLYKVCISRTSGIFRMYINGGLEIEVPDTIDYSPPIIEVPQLAIGAQVTVRNASYDFQGRIGKVKITKGVGRYTTSSYIPETLAKLTFTPSLVELTVAQPTALYSVTSSAPGTFVTDFINYDNLLNPNPKTLVFNPLPTISITNVNLNLIVGTPSDLITLSLLNATSDVQITFNLPPGLEFATAPIGLTGNTVTLNSLNQTVVFTLVSTTNGVLPFSVSNNKSLTNPVTQNFSSLFFTTLTKTEPLVKRVFLKDNVVGYDLEITNINEPTTVSMYVDNLIDDPYANNVSLLLDFNGEVNDTTIIDYSPRRKILNFGADFRLDHVDSKLDEICLIGNNNQSFLSVRQVDNVSTYSDLILGSGDFTIELEFLLTPSDNSMYLFECRTHSTNGMYLYITPAGLLWFYSLGTLILSTTFSINDGLKHHVAISRVSGQIYLLIDGVIIATAVISADYSQTPAHFAIGKQLNFINDASLFKGKLCSFKVTKGVGRYSSNNSNFGIKKLKSIPFRRTFTANNQNQLFDFKANKIGDYKILPYSDKVLSFPTRTDLTFEKTSSISLVSPSSTVTFIEESSTQYRINLIDPTIPVKITISLGSGLNFATGPTNLTGVNEITLDETNTFSVFTVTSDIVGNYTINITNNSGLNNPASSLHSFIEEGVDPPVINQNDLTLNLNKPDDTNHSLNIFQSII